MPNSGRVFSPHRPDVRIGFVPLLHAAPLLVAEAMGYFADERLSITLERQIGWGNVRDKLVYGHLQASLALVGMSPASVLGRDRFPEPVCSLMTVGTGGNGITVSRRLADAGVTSAATLLEWVRLNPGEPPVFAHVFSCSMHHYLLREWLWAGGIDPDRDVRLCVLPPPQVGAQMARGYLDGFCVGEPWNTAAENAKAGKVLASTAELLPQHPEKVLAVNQTWLARNGDAAIAMVRAVLRGCAFCNDPANIRQIAEILSKPGFLDMRPDVLQDALSRRETAGALATREGRRSTAPGHDPATMFPSATHATWILREMIRWGHLPPETDVIETARRSVQTDIFRKAAAGFGIACPDDDFPPMRLRLGWFDAKQAARSPASGRDLYPLTA